MDVDTRMVVFLIEREVGLEIRKQLGGVGEVVKFLPSQYAESLFLFGNNSYLRVKYMGDCIEII